MSSGSIYLNHPISNNNPPNNRQFKGYIINHYTYQIVYKNVKNITIKVRSSMQVEVVAPRFVTQTEIQQLLHKRDNWIRKHLARFQQSPTHPPEYISGEACYYLGERYLLKVVACDTDYAVLKQGQLYVYCQDPTDWARKQKIIEAFYRDKAQAYFHTILAKYQHLHNHDVVLRIKKMRTRWGSCNPKKGYINLNLALIQKPKRAIEYVVLHEIAHFTYPYHDRGFYNYVSTYMPDWKQAKQQLENSTR